MNCDVCAYRVRLPGYEEKVGTPLVDRPARRTTPRGWRARRAANQAAADAAERRERPRRGLGRRTGIPAAPDRGDGPRRPHRRPPPRVARRHRRPRRRRPRRGPGRAHRRPRPQRVGQDHPRPPPHRRPRPAAGDGRGRTSPASPWSTPTWPRSAAGSASSSRTPTTSSSCPRWPTTWPSARPTSASPATPWPPRVAAALDVVGLTDAADRAPQHLSMGERRRAALAGVLAVAPRGPRPRRAQRQPRPVRPPGRGRDRQGPADVTTLVITHDLPLALELCPRSVVLDRGRIVADGPTAALLANPALMAAHRLELPYGFSVPPHPNW